MQKQLRRVAKIIEIYSDTSRTLPKTIEYEFGDKSGVFNKGDTLLMYNPTKPQAVSATIAEIKLVQRNLLLDTKTLEAIGAQTQEELQYFIKQKGGDHRQDTLLMLEQITLVKNPHYQKYNSKNNGRQI